MRPIASSVTPKHRSTPTSRRDLRGRQRRPPRRSPLASSATEVERIARGLLDLGIGKGDRVGLFLPVIPEAAVALMACAKIGAVAVPAFSGYGPDPLAARLVASDAVALITVDGTTRRGKRVPMKDDCGRCGREGYGRAPCRGCLAMTAAMSR